MTLATGQPSEDNERRHALLTPANVSRFAKPYPFAARRALSLATKLKKGRLVIQMPDGARFLVESRNAGPCAEVEVRNFAFARKLAFGGDVGFAEAFVDGDWDTNDLTLFLELFCVNRDALAQGLEGKPIVRLARALRHRLRRNTRGGSRRNIRAHYDLGNDFYGAWLDETMTYSAALFDTQTRDLANAQIRKYQALADLAILSPDARVLEIGCGWGGFAIFAAQTYGCRVTGLTISRQQYEFARQRVFEAGLVERVDIKLQDYRDERGLYDRIVSIEMVEAVGEDYWSVWFQQLRNRLEAGGRAAIQAITIDELIFPFYRREVDFIRRYIFPGGMLPTAGILRELAERHGFALAAERAFGRDYGHTIALWRTRFHAAWPQLTNLGFDERFRRMWEYYFAYCEAGFRAGTIDVRQMAFAKGS